MFLLNVRAFVTLALAFGSAYGARILLGGDVSDSTFFIMVAAFCVMADLFQRAQGEDASFFHFERGAHLLFVPLWVLGTLWLGYVAYRFFDPRLPEQTRQVQLEDVES